MRTITIINVITIIMLLVSPVYASESSPSANIQTKLKALQNDIASKAAKLASQVSQKIQNRVYVGYVNIKSEQGLTLDTHTGSKSAKLNQYTQFVGKNFTLKNMKTGEYIAVLGDMDEKSVITAQKVVKLTSPTQKEKQIIWGVVTEKSPNHINLKNSQGKHVEVVPSSNTIYQRGKDKANLVDVKVDNTIVVVALKDNDKLKVRFVYIH